MTTSPMYKKRLGLLAYTGFGQCRLCGSFLDSQLEHGETCSTTAEATPGHYACVHAVLGGLKLADPVITAEPRGLTETQSRPADLFHHRCCPGTQRGSARVWHPPLQQQPEEMQRKQLLTAKRHITYGELKASSVANWSGQQPRSHPNPAIRSAACELQRSAKALSTDGRQTTACDRCSRPSWGYLAL